jgi:hypothetical protein
MASNRGGGPCCLGCTGLVLHCVSDQMVAADPVVHSVLPDQVLPCIPSSTVPGIVKVNQVPRLFLAQSRRKHFAAGIHMEVKTQEEKLLFIQTDFLTQPLQILFFSQRVKRLFPCCRFHLGVTVQGTLEDVLVPSNVQAFGLERHPQSLPPLLEIVFQRGLLDHSHERGHCIPFSHSVGGRHPREVDILPKNKICAAYSEMETWRLY